MHHWFKLINYCYDPSKNLEEKFLAANMNRPLGFSLTVTCLYLYKAI